MVMEEKLRALKLQIHLEVETALSNMQSTQARIGVTEQAARQAEESLRIEREEYRVGKGAIVDVLDAQSAFLNAQVGHCQALAAHQVALQQWKLATGDVQ